MHPCLGSRLESDACSEALQPSSIREVGLIWDPSSLSSAVEQGTKPRWL